MMEVAQWTVKVTKLWPLKVMVLWPVKVTLLWPMKEMVLWTLVMKMVPGIALDTLSFDLINANLFDCAFI
jgi:hypothetical protein